MSSVFSSFLHQALINLSVLLPEKGCPLLSLLLILGCFDLASHPSGVFSRMSLCLQSPLLILTCLATFLLGCLSSASTPIFICLFGDHILLNLTWNTFTWCLTTPSQCYKILTVVSCTILITYLFSRF